MKREKLEQIRELGKGGLSKGLSFIRSAAASNAAGANGDAASAELSAAAAADAIAVDAAVAPAAAAPGSSSGGNGNARMSYEDLVALSMKLTRQNKLMKTQFQRMHARIQETQAAEADAKVLTKFVSDEVGIDLLACQRLEASATGDKSEAKEGESAAEQDTSKIESSLDLRQITERYRIAEALKGQEHRQLVERLHAEIAQLRSTASSPVASSEGPVAALDAAYDDIDLLKSPVAAKAPVVTFATLEVESSESSQKIAELTAQLTTATMRVTELEAQIRISAAENQHKREQLTQQVTQQEELVQAISLEKHALEQQLDELRAVQADSETSWQQQLEQNEQLQLEMAAKLEQAELAVLKLQSERESAATTDEASASPVATDVPPESEQIPLKPEDTEENDSAELLAKLQTLEESVVTLQKENEALRSENASSPIEAENSEREFVALLQQLEAVKLEHAECDHTIRTQREKLQQTEEALRNAQTESEQNSSLVASTKEAMARLAAEVECQLEEREAFTRQRATLDQEIQKLSTAKDALEEELGVLRQNTNENLESTLAEVESHRKQFDAAVLEKQELEKQMNQEREYVKVKIDELVAQIGTERQKAEELESTLREKDKQMQKMVSSQTTMTSQMMELEKQVSSMESDLQMAAEGLEAHATRAEQSELRRQEAEGKMTNMKMKMDSMRDEHRSDFEMLQQEKNAEIERVKQDKSAISQKLANLDAEHTALQTKYRHLEGDLVDERKRLTELETRFARQTTELGNMSIDLAETKKALSDRMALATRLQTENMGIAGKQAEQAALIENALREAGACRGAQHEAEAKMRATVAEMERLKTMKDDTVAEMAKMQREMEKQREQVTADQALAVVKLQAAVDAEKETFKKDLERVEAESKHKSKLALQVVLEKEAEIGRLSRRLAELEEEVRTGDADSRKIFEFAQMQANREAEARALGMQMEELTQKLGASYDAIRQLEQEKVRLEEELTAMMQTQRREGVNMEYLKNVVVQYMSFRPGSSQQARLVPVLTTLLQFSSTDMAEIKEATANRRSSWGAWGSEKKEYKSIITGGTPPRPTSGVAASSASRTGSGSTLPSFSGAPFESPSNSRTSSFTLPQALDDSNANNGSYRPPSTRESADF